MVTLKELQEKENEITASMVHVQNIVNNLSTELRIIRSIFSESNCPHKIGDIITITNAYSNRDKKLLITNFLPVSAAASLYKDEHWKENWRVVGNILKKDGSESKLTGEEYGYAEPKK